MFFGAYGYARYGRYSKWKLRWSARPFPEDYKEYRCLQTQPNICFHCVIFYFDFRRFTVTANIGVKVSDQIIFFLSSTALIHFTAFLLSVRGAIVPVFWFFQELLFLFCFTRLSSRQNRSNALYRNRYFRLVLLWFLYTV